MDKNISLIVLVLLSLATLSCCVTRPTTKFKKGAYKELPNIEVKLVSDRANNVAGSPPLTPVVFWHGMGDTAYGSININRIALQKYYPNLPVLSVQIGGNVLEDELSGYFVNVNHQIESVCREILNDPVIKSAGSFNAVGFSQGAQFMRGLVQRCPLTQNGIKVKNLVSLGGQHQGVFGLPKCYNKVFCDHIRHLLSSAVYTPNVQEHLVQAEYWHDPKREDEYRSKNVFLADINNENNINETYIRNLLSLDNFVMVKFEQDEMVVPRESSLFGYYVPGQTKEMMTLEMSALYTEDRLGLKRLKESGRLHMISVPGGHLQYKMKWFMDNIASVYLV